METYYSEMVFGEATYHDRMTQLRASYGLSPIDNREFSGATKPVDAVNIFVALAGSLRRR